jgi:hypothetical protein
MVTLPDLARLSGMKLKGMRTPRGIPEGKLKLRSKERYCAAQYRQANQSANHKPRRTPGFTKRLILLPSCTFVAFVV